MKSRQIRKTHQDVVDAQISLHKVMQYLIEENPVVKREKEEEFRHLIAIGMFGQEAKTFQLQCGEEGIFKISDTFGGAIDKFIAWSQKGISLIITQGGKQAHIDMRDVWAQVYEKMIDCFPGAKELGAKMSAETPVREAPTSYTFDPDSS